MATQIQSKVYLYETYQPIQTDNLRISSLQERINNLMIKLRNLMETPLSGQDAMTISDMKDELDDLISERDMLANRVIELTNALSKSAE